MFDFGFTEILVAAVIGLLVIGPERLPRVARTLGRLFGKMQRYVSNLKDDINRHAEIEEFNQIRASVEDAAKDIEESVSTNVSYIEDQVKAAELAVKEKGESEPGSENKNDSVIPGALASVIGGQPNNKDISDTEQEKAEMESPSSTEAEKDKTDQGKTR